MLLMRNTTLDFFKGLAIILVICLHGAPLAAFPLGDFTLNTVMRFAVPLFLVISGYFLFKKAKAQESPGNIIKSFSFKFLKYYVIATVCLFGYDLLFFKPWVLQIIKQAPILPQILYYGILSLSTGHLWYLVAVFWSSIVVYFACRKNLENIKKVLIVGFVTYYRDVSWKSAFELLY